jgi:hypothetical protein
LARTVYTLRFPLIQALLAIGVLVAATAATAAPLPAADYAVRPACRPPAPGRAGCLALRLEPKTAPGRARVQTLAVRGTPRSSLAEASECAALYPSTCLSPQDLQSAYFPGEAPDAPSSAPQTIALVDAYNDLNAEADLNTYAEAFGLPACTKANGCFRKVGEAGSEAILPFPRSSVELSAFSEGSKHQREMAEEAEGWALETATDIEVAHAICQNCHILLVEASSPMYQQLQPAENTAVALHATEISNSWGGQESESDSSAFDHPGIAITAAAGDDGYLNWDQYATRNERGSPYFEGADYPASSPHVISVGGTELNLDEGAWGSESPWDSREGGGGSGCSESLEAPAWQRKVADWAQVGCGVHRASADVSADADPSTGVNVYDSTPYPQEGEVVVPDWAPIGGTSVAAPIIASMFALAGGAHDVAYPAETLYSHLGSTLLHDVTSGGNGECDGNYSTGCGGSLSSPLDCGADAWICNATIGYDGPTGVGTPNGIDAFLPSGGEPQSNPTEEKGQPQGTGSEGTTEGKEGSGVQPLGSSPSTNSGPDGTSVGAPPSRPGLLSKSRARISAVALTAGARAALHLGSLRATQLGFALSISRAVTVRVTLAVRVGAGRDAHWRALRGSLSFVAVKGLNRRRLRGAGKLTQGLYRLTFAPAGGTSRSISFRVP